MPGKFKIVVSDLHLGAGRESEGNLLEDFGSERAFASLLAEIAAESDREGADVELIVNGDAFEMLQVPHVDDFDPAVVYAPERYHSSSESDSVLKMALVIDGHRPFFDALKQFLQVGPPRRYVTFVKGNHDLNLYWPGVQDRMRRAIGATGAKRPLLSFEARRISREGIYVEHGNQYAAMTDQIEDMDDPVDPDKPGQLALPLGSWFVMDFFNKVEREKYWIDGVKPIAALVWYGLAFDFPFAARAIATLARALPGIVQHGILEAQEPQVEGLAQQLEDPAKVEELAARYETDEAFRAEFNAELASLLAPPQPVTEMGIEVEAVPLPTVSDPVAMGKQVQARVHSSLFKMAAKLAEEEKAKLVTFGHTHDAGEEELPGGGVYINSGTWTWRADLSGEGEKTWQGLFEHPERFTNDRRLSYVRIDYDEAGEPTGRLVDYEPSELPIPGPAEAASLWEKIVSWFRRLWS
jgi:UDP-2,3-diacylglucosamine pyrophosphatase LpxH